MKEEEFMPVQSCTEKGKPGYRWGNSGFCYTYSSGNEAARKKAKQRAYLQGAAITKGTMKEDELKEADLQTTKEGYLIEAKRPQDKPGGSNVGKYKGVKTFCGPSGGAPAGSFPVNTKDRAIAALSYARNAPNPSGIRACVKRHWPNLPAFKKTKKSVGEVLMLKALSGGSW